ncbi:aminotransferase, class V, partial [mine drainage metagenome]
VSAMSEFMTGWRDEGAPWHAWMAEVNRARQLFARLIGAEVREVAVVSCASEGAYHIASSLDLKERAEIVSSDMEFPSIAHVWLGQEARGATVRFADGGMRPDLPTYSAQIGRRTALVSVPLAGYQDGYLPPVAEVIAAAHAAGALAFVDAYQAA